ncbi:MAG: ribbon-helix-helix domain-containing protein [Opitutales bacterium]|jgi:predicted DNA-binding protein|nr:ribbon-helix-helix domain-containing protein [Opitutales bacterium]
MKTTLSIKVTENEKLRLKRAANARNKTPSDLMREALEMILNDPDIVHRESCFEVAEDLLPYGTSDMPADLSSNKDHLKGFGE